MHFRQPNVSPLRQVNVSFRQDDSFGHNLRAVFGRIVQLGAAWFGQASVLLVA